MKSTTTLLCKHSDVSFPLERIALGNKGSFILDDAFIKYKSAEELKEKNEWIF